MTPEILIGTRGWDDVSWQGGFYPAELPPEWRFCYFSNLLRAVLVPGELWASVADGDIAQWVEDSDPGFRFVLETPPAATPAEIAAFLSMIEPIRPQTDGFFVRAPDGMPKNAAWLTELFDALGDEVPVCVDLPASGQAADVAQLLAGRRIGKYWRCDRGTAPEPNGRLLLALSGGGTPMEIRMTLEALSRHSQQGGQAALFFEGLNAVESARAARTLAELMGI